MEVRKQSMEARNQLLGARNQLVEARNQLVGARNQLMEAHSQLMGGERWDCPPDHSLLVAGRHSHQPFFHPHSHTWKPLEMLDCWLDHSHLAGNSHSQQQEHPSPHCCSRSAGFCHIREKWGLLLGHIHRGVCRRSLQLALEGLV